MKKKLTLVIDDKVIERAKRHARAQNTSVSEMVESYLAEKTQEEAWSPPTGSVLARLTGALTPDTTAASDDERLERALREKYG